MEVKKSEVQIQIVWIETIQRACLGTTPAGTAVRDMLWIGPNGTTKNAAIEMNKRFYIQ